MKEYVLTFSQKNNRIEVIKKIEYMKREQEDQLIQWFCSNSEIDLLCLAWLKSKKNDMLIDFEKDKLKKIKSLLFDRSRKMISLEKLEETLRLDILMEV